MRQDRIDLYLISGFLGSGKTTLMKKLVSYLKDMKIAVIMNEFGSRGVDGALLGKDGFLLSEINEGSVFCSCKSDSFIDAILALSEKNIDIILVETSGMANPESMPSIMDVVQKKTERIFYHGCITLASADNIFKLLKTSLFAQGQIRYADALILNKTDLAAKEVLAESERMIKELNPYAKIYKTSFCNVPDIGRLFDILPHTPMPGCPAGYQTKGSSATKQFVLEMNERLHRDDLERFLHSIEKDVYRIKGFVTLLDGSTILIDGVTGKIPLKPCDKPVTDHFLVFIYPDDKPMQHIIRKKYDLYIKQRDTSLLSLNRSMYPVLR